MSEISTPRHLMEGLSIYELVTALHQSDSRLTGDTMAAFSTQSTLNAQYDALTASYPGISRFADVLYSGAVARGESEAFAAGVLAGAILMSRAITLAAETRELPPLDC